jgi:hypothetical protein
VFPKVRGGKSREWEKKPQGRKMRNRLRRVNLDGPGGWRQVRKEEGRGTVDRRAVKECGPRRMV